MYLAGFFRSDIAWKDAKYAQIWEYLRDEFELTQRFASLDFKLKFVEVTFCLGYLIWFRLILGAETFLFFGRIGAETFQYGRFVF